MLLPICDHAGVSYVLTSLQFFTVAVCRLHELLCEWTQKAGFSTFAEVIKRRHQEHYLAAQRSYLARCKLRSVVASPFSNYGDKKGYMGQGTNMFPYVAAPAHVKGVTVQYSTLTCSPSYGRGEW